MKYFFVREGRERLAISPSSEDSGKKDSLHISACTITPLPKQTT